MDAYNQKLLAKSGGNAAMADRLRMHWGISPRRAADCVACGLCETACTQHLNIVERLKTIAG
jgi:predicted aldo/keto reductase-like oxidoreductase